MGSLCSRRASNATQLHEAHAQHSPTLLADTHAELMETPAGPQLRATRPQAAIPSSELHRISAGLITLVNKLPDEPALEVVIDSYDFGWWDFFILEIPHLDTHTMSRIVNETFEHTYQLKHLRESFTVELGPWAALFSILFLSVFCNGSRKIQKAIVGPELIAFIYHVLLRHDLQSINGWGRALKVLRLFVDHHPSAIGHAFIDASPERFVSRLAEILSDAREADVKPWSACQELVSLIPYMSDQLTDPAGPLFRKLCREHVWPVVQDLLSRADVPSAWLVQQRGPEYIGSGSHMCAGSPNEKVANSLLGQSAADAFAQLGDPTFFSSLVSLVVGFYTNRVIRKADIDPNLIANLRQLLHRSSVHLDQLSRFSVQGILLMLSQPCESRLVAGRAREAYRASIKQVREHEVYQFSKCGNEMCQNMENATNQFQKCGGCNRERYCSRECQKIAWRKHKHTCDGHRRGE